VEIPIEQIAVVQKRLMGAGQPPPESQSSQHQMLESMTENRRPTRADHDVANAILDGTDCVMPLRRVSRGKISRGGRGHAGKDAEGVEPHRVGHPVKDRLKDLPMGGGVRVSLT